ncbi:helix-turn-helix domain-containing protein [Morganella psychrotolerans]|uniref:Helix-turn-helix domain-containing protein n=1 Tax=Morganella psychrotolerans TaxID=368603 RepID=A0A1B8HGZ0_9GAMM|nr:S24 family peptidase [Morganella psychrotolerans]KAA8717441.1 helix-turn-helix domain-containing protein [Morganella psychrotolerans]OBU07099.1 repressor [Morganella psychrotolerans]OBU08286.1 repressor [Morganella psychrotolerans]
MVQAEKVRNSFAQRLALACKDAGLNEHGRGAAIVKAIGVSSKAVSKWLNGESLPRQDRMNDLAKFLGCDVVWLQHGSMAGFDNNVSQPKPYKPSPKYPVISLIQAGAWNDACEAYSLDQIDEWYESEVHVQGSAFWLKVEGDSMTAPMGTSIPDGSLVLVDTGRDAINGSLVIAKLTDSNEATFKKLIIDGSARFLKGLNPAWPMTPINGNCKIIGVVVQMMMRFV